MRCVVVRASLFPLLSAYCWHACLIRTHDPMMPSSTARFASHILELRSCAISWRRSWFRALSSIAFTPRVTPAVANIDSAGRPTVDNSGSQSIPGGYRGTVARRRVALRLRPYLVHLWCKLLVDPKIGSDLYKLWCAILGLNQ